MSTISYEQRAAKVTEKSSNDSLLLIYEWVKTGQITFLTFEKLLTLRQENIERENRYDRFD